MWWFLFCKRNLKLEEYNVFTDKIFPQSSILLTFSSIIKNYNIANCKRGIVFEEYYFEHIINKEISLGNFNNSNFLFILIESFSVKIKKYNEINVKKLK